MIVPKVKNLDHADLVVIADTAERARQVPRLDRQAAPCSEDKAGVLPGPAESFPVSGLFVLAGNQWVSLSSDTVVVGTWAPPAPLQPVARRVRRGPEGRANEPDVPEHIGSEHEETPSRL